MKKGDLLKKAEQFNSEVGQFSAPNQFDVSSSTSGLASAWDTSSGIAIVGKIKSEIGHLESSLNDIEQKANSVKEIKVTVSFYENEEVEDVV